MDIRCKVSHFGFLILTANNGGGKCRRSPFISKFGSHLLFQNLATEMGKVSTALGAQGISQSPFDRDAKKFEDWVKSIEKYALLTELDDDGVKCVAYQSSRGPVSNFIRR